MKKILFILSITLLASCKKFLDLAPVSNANVQAFYKTPNDIMVAVNACYGTLQLDGQYRYAYWQFGEVRSDNTYNWDGAGNFPDAEIDQFKETSANAIITQAWEDTYHGIQLCNVVLTRIGGVTMSDALKNQYTGEAEFLRALMYFNLVRVYGDVPLVTKETASVSEGYSETRKPAADVYAQIVADLTDAAQKLPASYTGADIGRATKGAATGLLGKVYLTQGMYDKAATALQQVMSSSTYHLLSNYADLWKTANANNAESLFEVQFKKGGTNTGSNYYEQFAPRNSGTAVTGLGFAQGRSLPTLDLDTSYENGDIRKDASIAESYVLNGNTVYDRYTIKFRDQPFIDGDADNHWPVLRYADVLLMYAEALNSQNNGPTQQAYDAINQVRARAGLSPLAAGMGHDAFAQAISHERRVELAFEGQRWFDLARTGQAVQTMNKHFAGSIIIQPYQLLFPVPQTEVSVNPDGIKQNPGYN